MIKYASILLMCSILLIALLSKTGGEVDKAYRKLAFDMQKLRDACLRYKNDIGFVPEMISELYENSQNNERWRGPYLKEEVKINPWGNPYIIVFNDDFEQIGEKSVFEIFSFGPKDLFFTDDNGNKVPSYFTSVINRCDKRPGNLSRYQVGRPKMQSDIK